ncbi:hypothetical protein EJ04DRAFT_326702 [Polyplosphaeria fusca]|uniref:Uncharacterized protein n=1 Tax=Polyplosphaeria fusca TaxID=682080 RepID=A0A9P4V4E8_9PLEO|nr:hypothetical protein EJ04DRAFT_326702 [Polyplosphaeria fusca]
MPQWCRTPSSNAQLALCRTASKSPTVWYLECHEGSAVPSSSPPLAPPKSKNRLISWNSSAPPKAGCNSHGASPKALYRGASTTVEAVRFARARHYRRVPSVEITGWRGAVHPESATTQVGEVARRWVEASGLDSSQFPHSAESPPMPPPDKLRWEGGYSSARPCIFPHLLVYIYGVGWMTADGVSREGDIFFLLSGHSNPVPDSAQAPSQFSWASINAGTEQLVEAVTAASGFHRDHQRPTPEAR